MAGSRPHQPARAKKRPAPKKAAKPKAKASVAKKKPAPKRAAPKKTTKRALSKKGASAKKGAPAKKAPARRRVAASPAEAAEALLATTEPESPTSQPAPTMRALAGRFDLDAARAVWFTRQRLGGGPQEPLPELVARAGWLRTLGGADVYIAARARRSGMRRAELDDAVAAHALRVLPAARSCIYLVPEAHARLALSFAEGAYLRRTERELAKVGSSWEEVEEVGRAILATLGDGTKTTDTLRRSLPKGALRSFGEAGKKVGLASALPVALRVLELRSVLERTLEGGRLDSERYAWRLAQPLPDIAGMPAPSAEDLVAAIGTIFFTQMGPATTADFAAWAGLSQREASRVVARLDVVPITVEGIDEVCFVDREGLVALDQPGSFGDRVSFLSFEDNLMIPHGGPALFADRAHHHVEVMSWGTAEPTTIGLAKHLATRTVFIGDRLRGFWEYDPDGQEVVVHLLGTSDAAVADHVEAEATSLARFLFEDIGHARSFSLDTDDAVRERAQALRQMRARS